ncbi:D-alanine--D-alanine ligase [Actinobacteria bacterium YIM 96077]|uniref:D-alanine--D-alanine ligase n=1 Tax=Phytoactinopolyspora halophila TaxID=1981511 RepID=A0A329QB92_9ACTN|nr:D-alanine--D-alanine ligase [Phytoactinopolyspora halophila]AYY14143.1 D-alanine--D-alanine ligase [Actinobacteria bacterium YIM 96077]RAW09604.1 D-alanine--D-alanine ligase [Phytoactinopolyspora halophila]
MRKREIFVLGLDDFHRPLLEELPQARECRFHGLLPMERIRQGDRLPIAELVEEAMAELSRFDGPVDAVVGFWDFPINCMVPIISERLGIPHKPLAGVVACEHKYWARVVENWVIPGAIPAFEAVNPFAADAVSSIGLDYPFWLKPVMSYSSYLGFHIDGPETLVTSLETIRNEIGQLAEPFNHVLDMLDLPPDIAHVRGDWCIAEGIIGGRQCTLEGFVHNGTAKVYGIVDSLRVPGGVSFASYRYPSDLPEGVQQRMESLACRTVEALGLGESAWNVECFWDEGADQVWLLEVNSRLSESHSDLFSKVDGVSNQAVMLDLALDREPSMPHRAGKYAHAGKFFVRHVDDAYVERVPSPEEVAAIERDVPDTRILIRARAGQWLHELAYQDTYSYELAWIHVGGNSVPELEERYRECAERLRFDFADEGERNAQDLSMPDPRIREANI